MVDVLTTQWILDPVSSPEELAPPFEVRHPVESEHSGSLPDVLGLAGSKTGGQSILIQGLSCLDAIKTAIPLRVGLDPHLQASTHKDGNDDNGRPLE
jgi:hypothetical protein